MTDPAPRRKLAAILAADVVGFSLKMGENEDRTLKNLRACRAITDEFIRAHHGRIFTTAGDSVIAEFASPVDAIEAALGFQKSLLARNASCDEVDRMVLRVGLNLGDVIVEGDNLLGDGVNVAARIESSAKPGGIHVSAKFHDEVRRKIAVDFESLGEQQFKNIVEPIATFRVIFEGEAVKPYRQHDRQHDRAESASRPEPAAHLFLRLLASPLARGVGVGVMVLFVGAGGYLALHRSPKPNINPFSIVVMPFANLTGDPNDAYVADGMTSQVARDLLRIRDAVVLDAVRTLPYKDKPTPVVQIARELGVRFVLQGEVKKSGNTLQINAQLSDASANQQLWTQSFIGDMSNLFELQDQVTNRISGSLGPRMLIVAASETEKRKSNPQASDLILRSRVLLEKGFDVETLDQRVALYRKALVIEPDNLEAMSGLAQALGMLAPRSPEQDQRAKRFEELHQLALKVKELDPANRDIYSALIFYDREKGDLIGAKQNAEKNLQLNPKSKSPYITLGNILNQSGEPQKAIDVLTQGLNLDPLNPTDNNLSALGRANIILGHTDQAIEWLTKANQVNAKVAQIWAYLAIAYTMKGDSDKAAMALAQVKTLNPNSNEATLTFFIKPLPDSLPAYKDWYEQKFLPLYRKAGLPI